MKTVMVMAGSCGDFCRHCERSEAIHRAASGEMDCFVACAPRNDGPENTRLIDGDASVIIEL
jgi:hypothetical protein